MPSKRSRMMRSSSTGDAEVVTPPPCPPTGSQDVWRQHRIPTITRPMEFSTNSAGKSVSTDQPHRPIFRIPSPVYDHPYTDGESARGVNIIFDKCYHCNKMIPQDGDVFMYSLRAFCSEECREKHICIEEGSTERASDAFEPRPKRQNAP